MTHTFEGNLSLERTEAGEDHKAREGKSLCETLIKWLIPSITDYERCLKLSFCFALYYRAFGDFYNVV